MSRLGRVGLIVLLPVAAPAAEPSAAWYRGLIGRTATGVDTPGAYEKNKEIELRLEVEDGLATGRYFYFTATGRGGDITLRGARDADGTLRLEETADGRVTGRWRGRVEGDVFSGSWTDPSGMRRLKFFLRELPDLDGEEKEVAAGIAFRPRRVLGTNLAVPFLTRHPDANVLAKVNTQIEQMFAGARCGPDVEFLAWPDDHDLQWKVAYASPDLWSVEASLDFMCGAPYPTSEDRSFTVDLRTGALVTFEGLFRDFAKDEEAILEMLFADAVKAASEECRDARESMAMDEAGGRSGLRLLSRTFAFHLTDTALVAAESDLVHAVQGCRAQATVPYERLQRFVPRDGAIARILAGRRSRR